MLSVAQKERRERERENISLWQVRTGALGDTGYVVMYRGRLERDRGAPGGGSGCDERLARPAGPE